MNTKLPFSVSNDGFDLTPPLAIIYVTLDTMPHCRRTIARKPGEHGHIFWERVQATARAVADRLPPVECCGNIDFAYDTSERFEQQYGTDEAFNHRAVLTWFCGEQFSQDVRLWAGSKLWALYGPVTAQP